MFQNFQGIPNMSTLRLCVCAPPPQTAEGEKILTLL